MASAQRTKVFDVGIQAFYDVIVDYKSYPEFVDNVRNVRIIKTYDDRIRAKYFLHILKDFDYTLDLYHEPPKAVWWTFVRGSFFKKLDGRWDLKRKGKNKTEVTYTLDVEAKIMAPRMLLRSLVSVSLPKMMDDFAARAKALSEG